MSRRATKIVQTVKAKSYGHSLKFVPMGNKYAGKPYGPHRSKIAAHIRSVRSAIKSRFPSSKVSRGHESANEHYLR